MLFILLMIRTYDFDCHLCYFYFSFLIFTTAEIVFMNVIDTIIAMIIIFMADLIRWTGMIAELRSQKADMAVIDMSVTSIRQTAVDFTMPFMSTGVRTNK